MSIRVLSGGILIAYGEHGVRREVERALAYGDLTCRDAFGAAEALSEIAGRLPDLLILDLQLPDQSGIGVCRQLRESHETARLPIIAVSSQASEIDRVLAFESGADDFIARPFHPAELRARVGAVLRGCAATRRDRTVFGARGPVEIDVDAGRIRVEGRGVDLTVREFALIRMLAANPGRVVRRRHLIDQVWRGKKPPTERAIDAHVKSIRRKLGHARDCIETVRGVGYRFAEASDPPESPPVDAEPS